MNRAQELYIFISQITFAYQIIFFVPQRSWGKLKYVVSQYVDDTFSITGATPSVKNHNKLVNFMM